eukprot:1159092-Pelagomonas_calceolata.AAC.4
MAPLRHSASLPVIIVLEQENSSNCATIDFKLSFEASFARDAHENFENLASKIVYQKTNSYSSYHIGMGVGTATQVTALEKQARSFQKANHYSVPVSVNACIVEKGFQVPKVHTSAHTASKLKLFTVHWNMPHRMPGAPQQEQQQRKRREGAGKTKGKVLITKHA